VRFYTSRLLSVVLGFVVCYSAVAQGPRSDPAPEAVVSFELYHNRVYVPVTINGAGPFTFVLDTGAAWSGVEESRAHDLHLKSKGTATLIGNGQQKVRVEVLRDLELSIAGVPVKESQAVAVRLEELESFEGRRIDGILGVRLFQEHVVEIDYARQVLRLYPAATYTYRGSGEAVPLHFGNGTALLDGQIEVRSGELINARLAIDLGTYSALRLYRHFLSDHRDIFSGLHSTESFGFGMGGEFPESQARVASLYIGKLKLSGPLVELSEATGGATATGAYAGTVGGDILRRFTVILDYAHSRSFLEPNASFAAPFEADLSGVILAARGADLRTVTIHHVEPHSAAFLAGVQVGDIISSVNGIDAQKLGVAGLYEMFKHPGTYALTVTRGGRPIPLTLSLEPLHVASSGCARFIGLRDQTSPFLMPR